MIDLEDRLDGEETEKIVRACCICHSIYREHRKEWINIDEPLYKEILLNYNVSHGYCSIPCLIKQGAKPETIKRIYKTAMENEITKNE